MEMDCSPDDPPPPLLSSGDSGPGGESGGDSNSQSTTIVNKSGGNHSDKKASKHDATGEVMDLFPVSVDVSMTSVAYPSAPAIYVPDDPNSPNVPSTSAPETEAPSAANGLYCPICDITFTKALYGNIHLESEHLNWCLFCRRFLDFPTSGGDGSNTGVYPTITKEMADVEMAVHFSLHHAYCPHCTGKFENDYYFRRHLADQKKKAAKTKYVPKCLKGYNLNVNLEDFSDEAQLQKKLEAKKTEAKERKRQQALQEETKAATVALEVEMSKMAASAVAKNFHKQKEKNLLNQLEYQEEPRSCGSSRSGSSKREENLELIFNRPPTPIPPSLEYDEPIVSSTVSSGELITGVFQPSDIQFNFKGLKNYAPGGDRDDLHQLSSTNPFINTARTTALPFFTGGKFFQAPPPLPTFNGTIIEESDEEEVEGVEEEEEVVSTSNPLLSLAVIATMTEEGDQEMSTENAIVDESSTAVEVDFEHFHQYHFEDVEEDEDNFVNEVERDLEDENNAFRQNLEAEFSTKIAATPSTSSGKVNTNNKENVDFVDLAGLCSQGLDKLETASHALPELFEPDQPLGIFYRNLKDKIAVIKSIMQAKLEQKMGNLEGEDSPPKFDTKIATLSEEKRQKSKALFRSAYQQLQEINAKFSLEGAIDQWKASRGPASQFDMDGPSCYSGSTSTAFVQQSEEDAELAAMLNMSPEALAQQRALMEQFEATKRQKTINDDLLQKEEIDRQTAQFESPEGEFGPLPQRKEELEKKVLEQQQPSTSKEALSSSFKRSPSLKRSSSGGGVSGSGGSPTRSRSRSSAASSAPSTSATRPVQSSSPRLPASRPIPIVVRVRSRSPSPRQSQPGASFSQSRRSISPPPGESRGDSLQKEQNTTKRKFRIKAPVLYQRGEKSENVVVEEKRSPKKNKIQERLVGFLVRRLKESSGPPARASALQPPPVDPQQPDAFYCPDGCQEGGMRFRTVPGMLKHVAENHPGHANCDCPQLPTTVRFHPPSLVTHLISTHVCPGCGLLCHDIRQLAGHLKRQPSHCGPGMNQAKLEKLAEFQSNYSECSKDGDEEKAKQKFEEEPKVYRCRVTPFCGAYFWDRDCLLAHYVNIHPQFIH